MHAFPMKETGLSLRPVAAPASHDDNRKYKRAGGRAVWGDKKLGFERPTLTSNLMSTIWRLTACESQAHTNKEGDRHVIAAFGGLVQGSLHLCVLFSELWNVACRHRLGLLELLCSCSLVASRLRHCLATGAGAGTGTGAGAGAGTYKNTHERSRLHAHAHLHKTYKHLYMLACAHVSNKSVQTPAL